MILPCPCLLFCFKDKFAIPYYCWTCCYISGAWASFSYKTRSNYEELIPPVLENVTPKTDFLCSMELLNFLVSILLGFVGRSWPFALDFLLSIYSFWSWAQNEALRLMTFDSLSLTIVFLEWSLAIAKRLLLVILRLLSIVFNLIFCNYSSIKELLKFFFCWLLLLIKLLKPIYSFKFLSETFKIILIDFLLSNFED